MSGRRPSLPPMPDLSHLTEEERKIIESVIQRQREEEEREQEILRNLQDDFDTYQQSVKKLGEESKQTQYGNQGAVCQICHKTKFADGIGHQCHYCKLRSCARCGGKLALRSAKTGQKIGDQTVWSCNLCKKKQEILVKTGQWYHGGMAKPVALDVDTGSDASSVKTDASPPHEKKAKFHERPESGHSSEKENIEQRPEKQGVSRTGSLHGKELKRQYSMSDVGKRDIRSRTPDTPGEHGPPGPHDRPGGHRSHGPHERPGEHGPHGPHERPVEHGPHAERTREQGQPHDRVRPDDREGTNSRELNDPRNKIDARRPSDLREGAQQSRIDRHGKPRGEREREHLSEDERRHGKPRGEREHLSENEGRHSKPRSEREREHMSENEARQTKPRSEREREHMSENEARQNKPRSEREHMSESETRQTEERARQNQEHLSERRRSDETRPGHPEAERILENSPDQRRSPKGRGSREDVRGRSREERRNPPHEPGERLRERLPDERERGSSRDRHAENREDRRRDDSRHREPRDTLDRRREEPRETAEMHRDERYGRPGRDKSVERRPRDKSVERRARDLSSDRTGREREPPLDKHAHHELPPERHREREAPSDNHRQLESHNRDYNTDRGYRSADRPDRHKDLYEAEGNRRHHDGSLRHGAPVPEPSELEETVARVRGDRHGSRYQREHAESSRAPSVERRPDRLMRGPKDHDPYDQYVTSKPPVSGRHRIMDRDQFQEMDTSLSAIHIQHLDPSSAVTKVSKNNRRKVETMLRNDSLSSDPSDCVRPPPPKPHKHKKGKKMRQQSLSSSEEEIQTTPECTSGDEQEIESESVSEKGELESYDVAPGSIQTPTDIDDAKKKKVPTATLR